MNELHATINLIIVIILVAVLGGCGFYFSRNQAVKATQPHASKLKERLDRANVQMRSEDIAVGLVAGSAILWAVLVFTLQLSIIIAVLSLPLVVVVAYKAFESWVDYRIAKRLANFNNQLEMVLRMMSSAIRSGLGLRQAIIMVTEEMPDPVKYEFNLTIMQTNIGMSINDALARLATRMPSQEIQMFAKAISVQSQTGGNLGKTLDHLASTIKDRRKLFRKVKAITAESRAGAIVIGSLPVVVSVILMMTQPEMRENVLGTDKGHVVIAIACVLEASGLFALWRILSFKV